MSKMAPAKRQVFVDLRQGVSADYRGIPIRFVVSEHHDKARFEAKMEGVTLYDEQLKKLLQKVDRRLAGKKVRLDITVFIEQFGRGEQTKITTVNEDGSVNLSSGHRDRQKLDKYDIQRKLSHYTDENKKRWAKIRELSIQKHHLEKEIRQRKSEITRYTSEEIEALVEAKTKEE